MNDCSPNSIRFQCRYCKKWFGSADLFTVFLDHATECRIKHQVISKESARLLLSREPIGRKSKERNQLNLHPKRLSKEKLDGYDQWLNWSGDGPNWINVLLKKRQIT